MSGLGEYLPLSHNRLNIQSIPLAASATASLVKNDPNFDSSLISRRAAELQLQAVLPKTVQEANDRIIPVQWRYDEQKADPFVLIKDSEVLGKGIYCTIFSTY